MEIEFKTCNWNKIKGYSNTVNAEWLILVKHKLSKRWCPVVGADNFVVK